MRFVVVICLVSVLLACGSAPKDYSSAKKLGPINNRLTVKPLWIKKTGEVPVYSHAQLTPTINDGKIYVSSVNGDVGLMDADNGKWLWSVSLKENLTSGPGVGESLIFLGSRNAEAIALDKNTGQERWRASMTSEMLATPLVAGQSLFVQTIDGKIVSLDISSGKLIWSYSHDIPKLTLRGTASPIIDGDQLIAGFADGKLVSLNTQTGELNWKVTVTEPRGRTDLERLADIDGLFQASNGSVYVTSYQGRVAAVSLTDGTIQWARKMSSYNGLTISNGHIYISDTEGQVWSLDARTGATLWRQNNLIGRDTSTPVVVDNAVVVADYDGYVHWLSLDDGQFVARQSLNEVWGEAFDPLNDAYLDEMDGDSYPRLVTVSPFANNNIVYVRDNTGAFAAFRVESKAR